MAGTELGQSALERVEPQRGRLGAALHDYELAVLDPGADWAGRVAAPLDRLRVAFEEHVEFTEGPDGLFEHMLDDDTIEVASEIDQLRRDHITVAVAMERAREGLASPPSDEAHLREIVASVARLVGRHRRTGAQLLYDVYSVDTPGGD
ncbi:MAG TPA: hypothetical protein VFZ17_13000 [Acidimicrobiia bacterium]|nr:hypothetical protein [Acidimicrobiia bacterium]